MQRRALSADLPEMKAAPARSARQALRRRLLGLMLLGGLSLLGPLGGFLWFLDAAAAVPDQPLRRTDGIVVLTGGGERVRSGLALLVAGEADRLLVSGAHPDVTLADLASISGLPLAALEGRVTLGRQARTTRGNAAETAAWARAERLGSIRLVTAGYHMPRARLELRRMLPPGTALVQHPVQPASLRGSEAAGRSRTWTLLLGEYLKFLGARLRLSQLLAPPQEAR